MSSPQKLKKCSKWLKRLKNAILLKFFVSRKATKKNAIYEEMAKKRKKTAIS